MSHKFDSLLQPQKILQFLIPFEPLPAFSPQKNQSYKLVSFEIASWYAFQLECSAKGFYPPHYNWKVTSRLSGYFTKILQKNCREIFPTTAYKKEVRYYSNFLFRFNCKSISRQNVKHSVTIDRRFRAISKGNSTLIRRNRNSKRVPRRYRFPRPAQRSSYRFYRYLREQIRRKRWIS